MVLRCARFRESFAIRTSNFRAEAEHSYIFLRFEAENVLKMFLNLHGTRYFNKSKVRECKVNYLDNTTYHLMTLMIWKLF